LIRRKPVPATGKDNLSSTFALYVADPKAYARQGKLRPRDVSNENQIIAGKTFSQMSRTSPPPSPDSIHMIELTPDQIRSEMQRSVFVELLDRERDSTEECKSSLDQIGSKLNGLDKESKEKAFVSLFPTIAPLNVKWTLQKVKWDTVAAFYQLKYQCWLDERRIQRRGTEAFSTSESPSRQRKGKGPARPGLEMDGGSSTKGRVSITITDSEAVPGFRLTKWEKAKTAEAAKSYLPTENLGTETSSAVLTPLDPDVSTYKSAQWGRYRQLVKDPDLVKRKLASHPIINKLLDDVDSVWLVYLLRDVFDAVKPLNLMGRYVHNFRLLLPDVVNLLESLEDGPAANETAETEIASTADGAVEGATPESTNAARRRPPSASPPSNEDHFQKPGEHTDRELSKISISSPRRQATNIGDKFTSRKEAWEEVQRTARRIDERLNGPRALRSIEVTPQTEITESKRNLMVPSQASDTAKNIAAEAKRDSSAMKTIAIIGGLFWPGMFVAAVCTILFS
jgi:hypothetical protein